MMPNPSLRRFPACSVFKNRVIVGASCTLLLLILSGCAGASQEAADENIEADTEVEGTEEQAAAASPWEDAPQVDLRYADITPEGSFSTGNAISKLMADRIEERTEGTVTFEFYYSGSLLPGDELLPGIAAGTADLGFTPFIYDDSFAPLANVPELPGVAPQMGPSVRAAVEYYTGYEPVIQQLEEVNLKFLWAHVHPGEAAIGTQSPVEGPEDLDGLTTRAASPLWGRALARLGVETLTLPVGEVYTGLERGTVDSANTFVLGFRDQSWYEQLEHITELGAGTSIVAVIAMNLDTWNSLSPEQQQVITEEAAWAQEEFVAQVQDKYDEAVAFMRESGVNIVQDPPEELASAVSDAADAVADEWAADLDSEGLPGTEALEFFRDLVREQQETEE